MPLLKVDSITTGYGEMEVLRDVTLEVAENEIVSIIGPNGAGKSTVMKTVFGLLAPWQGSITFDGTDISGFAPDRIGREGMCLVPQVGNVGPALTVAENLEMGACGRRGPVRGRMG